MRRPGWRLAPLTVGLFLLAAVPVPAQDQEKKPPSTEFLQGTEAFRRTIYDMEKDLYKVEVTPIKTFNDLDDPKHTLIIVFGAANLPTESWPAVEDCVQRGGALFLATDRRLPWDVETSVSRMTGYTVSGQMFTCDDDASCYRRLNYCPYVRPQTAAPDLFRNLILPGADVSKVATNAPSCLTSIRGPHLPVLAWLPEQSRPEGQGGEFGDFLFAAGGDLARGGRILVLADHSIFINEMLMQEDNGNLDFSYNCLKWMTEGPNGPRTRVLFVEEKGGINSKFDVPLKEMPDELLDRLLDFAGRVLQKAARKAGPFIERKARLFDEQLPEWCYENGVSPYGVLLVALAVFVVVYGCWKVGWRARYRSDMQGPLLATALHGLAPAGAVPEQRRLAQVCGDNVWEPARDLARQCLAEAGAKAGAAPPRVAVRGGWLRRWTMAGRLRRLWRLAFGPPLRVRLNQLPRLLREVQEMRAAFADGTIQWR